MERKTKKLDTKGYDISGEAVNNTKHRDHGFLRKAKSGTPLLPATNKNDAA